MGVDITFFRDSSGSYSIPRAGRRLPESERIRRRIEEVTLQKWGSPEDRDQLDELLEPLRARLRFLEQNPDQDRPS